MNSSTLRRLASDQASLRRSLPPNYLFPQAQDVASLPDDLTQLTVLLTGAHGTPYAKGLWRLHLSMPNDYPKSPPKATFKTRIYHPNVEESTGAVCLDTLKKDWQSKLTLRDILLTISCLLIHPNPDSALNAAAGALLQEDYEAFAKQAKLMTSIHAPIPKHLHAAVTSAKRRGEEEGAIELRSERDDRPTVVRASSSSTSIVMKRKALSTSREASQPIQEQTTFTLVNQLDISDDDEEHDEGKENDPSQSPSPVLQAPPSPRKNVLGKRPLSELPTPMDPDTADPFAQGAMEAMTSSEQNISANEQSSQLGRDSPTEPARKSPKLDRSAEGLLASSRQSEDNEDRGRRVSSDSKDSAGVTELEEEKENLGRQGKAQSVDMTRQGSDPQASLGLTKASRPTLRKVSNMASSRGKGQARVGIRRL